MCLGYAGVGGMEMGRIVYSPIFDMLNYRLLTVVTS